MNRVGFVALLCALSAVSLADTLPLGITAAAAVLDDSSGSLCSQSSATYAACSAGGSSAVANVTNGTGGLASVTLGSNTSGGAAVTAYYMYLQGPSNVQVPVVINGMASTTDNSGDFGASYAAYYIYQDSTKGFSYVGQYFASANTCAILASASVNCMSAGTFSLDATLTSDTVFFVFFEAAAGGTNASAFIDPTISVNPNFAQVNQFSVVANQGVFNPPATATPEPAASGLTAGALLAIIAAGKRRLQHRARRNNSVS